MQMSFLVDNPSTNRVYYNPVYFFCMHLYIQFADLIQMLTKYLCKLQFNYICFRAASLRAYFN